MSETLNQYNKDVDDWVGSKTTDQSILKDDIVNLLKRAAANGDGALTEAALKALPNWAPNRVLSATEDGFVWVDQSGGEGLPTLPVPLLTLTVISSSQVDATFGPSEGSTGYVLQRSDDSGFSVGLVTLYTGSETSYSDESVEGGMNYHYRLKATGAGYKDSNYDVAIATTPQSFNTTVEVGETTEDGVTLVAVEGVQFMYNSPTPSGDAFAGVMALFVGGEQIGAVDFLLPYVGQPCAVVYNGTTYYTTFINGNRNL